MLSLASGDGLSRLARDRAPDHAERVGTYGLTTTAAELDHLQIARACDALGMVRARVAR